MNCRFIADLSFIAPPAWRRRATFVQLTLSSHRTVSLRGTKRRQLLAAYRHATDREVIKRRDRISLRPQADTAGSEAMVVVIEIELAVEPRLDVIPHRHHPDRVPLPEGRCLHPRARQLPASAVLAVPAEIAFESL